MTAVTRLLALSGLTLLFLTVAFWNRFPLVFYDTGAYLAEGLSGAFFVERSPVYSLLLPLTGAFFSLWWVAAAQSLMTALLIGAALVALTGIGWYVGQIEPDCFTPLVVLGSYLLLFRADVVTGWRRGCVIAITALGVACHPSHLGLIGGLLICAGLLWSVHGRLPGLPRPRLWPCLSALLLSLVLVVTANYAFTRTIFVSRAGSVFLLARLMQDGIAQRLLADTCPPAGSREKPPYTLCPYGAKLPHNANAWLWGAHSSFHAVGGFRRSDGEYGRIVRDSFARYPLMHLKAAVIDSAQQFVEFKTGDGIESQRSILIPGFRQNLPNQLRAYLAARQQIEIIRFKDINLIHVPVGVIALLGLVLLLRHAAMRGRWGDAALPVTVLLALLGNAIICGTFSNPHDRYQSRLMWLPILVLLLARARDPKALQPVPESGT